MTCDNAENNRTMLTEMKRLLPGFQGNSTRVRCFGHILNLVVKVSPPLLLCQHGAVRATSASCAKPDIVHLSANISLHHNPSSTPRVPTTATMNHGYPPAVPRGNNPPGAPQGALSQRLNELLDQVRNEFEAENQRSVEYEGQSEYPPASASSVPAIPSFQLADHPCKQSTGTSTRST